ncbi:hypothetical protein AB0J21_14270 [Streptomyces sp. NPDC049954]|uniref:hypothetical protein n=1 Tax=Streptomyces sp. NPDC049954 TaxID=3155779 RepID=UPI003431C346
MHQGHIRFLEGRREGPVEARVASARAPALALARARARLGVKEHRPGLVVRARAAPCASARRRRDRAQEARGHPLPGFYGARTAAQGTAHAGDGNTVGARRERVRHAPGVVGDTRFFGRGGRHGERAAGA